jgi:hypothetical protein
MLPLFANHSESGDQGMLLVGGKTKTFVKRGVNERSYGTLGVVLKTENDWPAFLTAGHTVGLNQSKVFIDGRTEAIGTVYVNLLHGHPSIDVAIVRLDDDVQQSDVVPMTATWSKPPSARPQRAFNGFGECPRVGTEIELVGAKTGKHAARVTAQSLDGWWQDSKKKKYKVSGIVGIAVSGAETGDSGGPVFLGKKLIGIFTGAFATTDDVNGTNAHFVPYELFAQYAFNWSND